MPDQIAAAALVLVALVVTGVAGYVAYRLFRGGS